MPPQLARSRGCVPALRSFPLPFNFEPSTINRLFGFSPFNFELSTFNSFSLSPFPATLTRIPPACRKTFRVSPFFATLKSSLQLTENTATLSPFAATLTDFVNHNPFVCHSYRKHPGWGLHPSSQVFSFRNLTTRHPLESALTKKPGGGAPPTAPRYCLKPLLQLAHPYVCTCKKGPAAREPRYSPCAAS